MSVEDLMHYNLSGKAAIVELETTSYMKESGEALCMNRSASHTCLCTEYKQLICIYKFIAYSCRSTIYLRGAGGFSKSSPAYSYAGYPANQVLRVSIPRTKPNVVCEELVQLSQASHLLFIYSCFFWIARICNKTCCKLITQFPEQGFAFIISLVNLDCCFCKDRGSCLSWVFEFYLYWIAFKNISWHPSWNKASNLSTSSLECEDPLLNQNCSPSKLPDHFQIYTDVFIFIISRTIWYITNY